MQRDLDSLGGGCSWHLRERGRLSNTLNVDALEICQTYRSCIAAQLGQLQ